jgi:preprotein translocase subunit SecY
MIDLVRRIAFTIGALLVWRLGTYVPLPGLDPTHLYGGAFHRLAVFSLGILPYIWASIIVQVLMSVSSRLRALKRGGAQGRRTVDRLTYCLTALLAAVQANGVAIGVASVPELIVFEPRWLFTISTIATLTGGTLLLVWLSEQITLRGIGNGLVLMLLLPILIALPSTFADLIEFGRQGLLARDYANKLVLFFVGLVVFTVLMERARRLVHIHYAGRTIGVRTFGEQISYLPLKLNIAGIIPVLLASWAMNALVGLTMLFTAGSNPSRAADLIGHLAYGQPLHLALYALLIFCFALLWTALTFDPTEMAEDVRTQGGSIATVAPGEATATYIDSILSRYTLTGACYLVVLVIAWEMCTTRFPVPLHFNAVSLLIVVCATLDLECEVRARMRRDTKA